MHNVPRDISRFYNTLLFNNVRTKYFNTKKIYWLINYKITLMTKQKNII